MDHPSSGPVTVETVLAQIAKIPEDTADGWLVPAEVLQVLADEIHRLRALLLIYRSDAEDAGAEWNYEGDADDPEQ